MKISWRRLFIICILISLGLLVPATALYSSAAQVRPNQPNASVVGVAATTLTAGPHPGVFTITRTDPSNSLSINFGMGGTAGMGLDYTLTSANTLDFCQPFAAGTVGQAFNFDGNDRYVQFPHVASQDPTEEATLDAWIYFNQLPSEANQIMTIIAKSDFGRDLDLQVEADNKIHFYIGFAGLGHVASNTVVAKNTWYHVAATYKANTEVKMYVNGVLENTTPISIARSANGHPVTIGESYYFRDRYFNGRIDEAQMFNLALSATQIQSIYAAGSAGLCKPDAVPGCVTPPAGLVGWWPGDSRAVDLVTGQAGVYFGQRLILGAGQTTATINVNPTGATGSAGTTVVLSLVQDPAYFIDGQQPSAFVTLTGLPDNSILEGLGIHPDRGGDGGTLTALILGRGIEQGATAKLTLAGHPDIVGTDISVAPDGLSLTATFDLTGKARGVYDVVVTNPNSMSSTLPAAFTVEPASAQHLYVQVISRPVIRIGNTYPFYVTYGNRGNNHVTDIPLYVSVPNFVTITPETNLSYQVGQDGDRTLITIMVPKVKVGLPDVLTVKIKVADPNEMHHLWRMRASIGHPYIVPTTPQSASQRSPGAAPSTSGALGELPPPSPPPDPDSQDDGGRDSDNRTPNDPNDKSGPGGFGPARYIPGETALPYVIYFENKPEASLPAQDVTVTDQLDPNLVDLSTFNFGVISFGNRTVIPPIGQTEFATTVDLRPARQLIVKITGKLNTTTGLVRWDFNSLDPHTGEAPDDPLLGFLPPNVTSPEGQGSMLFTVRPKATLVSGAEITNQARIVFDVNPPIDTPQLLNTIDNVKPTSQVMSLPAAQCNSFLLQWSGSDASSGIFDYTIYVSDNGGPFEFFLRDTTATSATFNGQTGHSYAFYSVAQDNVGNAEDAPATPDATTIISAAPSLSSASQSFPAGGGNGIVNVTAPAGCSWQASTTDSFITLTEGASGSGDGTVTYSVAAHSNTSNRSGTITIAGQIFTVVQGAAFLDVPVSHPFYTEIGKLSARGVTLGCGGGNYCPDQVVTREQMAAFIMRARGEFNPPNPATQRFEDVPATHPFYTFIDRMAVLEITLGCSASPPLYCPTQPVRRDQMAAFLIRALHEPGYIPPPPAAQRFEDVESSHPFYAHIEEMAVRGITLGCSANPPLYCPTVSVTRAQMAAFLVRAFGL
jgi:hypothetical protein